MPEIYEKGQVVIPKFIRDMFGFKPGTEVGFKVEGQRVYIEKAYDWLSEFEKLRSQATDSDEEIDRAMRLVEKKRNKERLRVP
jgi:AbrB family looped-hinge helix DNA binding protein